MNDDLWSLKLFASAAVPPNLVLFPAVQPLHVFEPAGN